jgi:hypothetical protein
MSFKTDMEIEMDNGYRWAAFVVELAHKAWPPQDGLPCKPLDPKSLYQQFAFRVLRRSNPN